MPADTVMAGVPYGAVTRNPFNYVKVEQINRDNLTAWLTLEESLFKVCRHPPGIKDLNCSKTDTELLPQLVVGGSSRRSTVGASI